MSPTDPTMSLGTLADPREHTDPIDLRNEPTAALVDYYAAMTRIRLAEQSVAELVLAGEVKCPCHLGIGQEAIAVGVSAALRTSDRVYGGHRSHAHYLALGGSMDAMMAEIMGKRTGASRGMGGSMHLYGPEVGFHGSVPIVGATIPIAAGAALAARMDGRGDVAVAYFGDGACEEGVFHETLNMAAIMKLPILFVCENNLYSSHLDIAQRQLFDSVARFARAAGIATEVVDGNDVVAVADSAARLIGAARSAPSAVFLEAVTFRWRGHVGPHEDIDVGVRRSTGQLDAWKMRDPIGRLRSALIAQRQVAPRDFDRIDDDAQAEIESAVNAARAAEYPDEEALLGFVYAPAGEGMPA